MSKNRVVITGIGIVTPLGNKVDQFWQALIEGKSAVNYITIFDTTGFEVKIAAEIKDFKPENWLDPKEVRKLDRFAQFALCSAIDSIKDSNLDFSTCDRTRCGVILGSGIGGLGELQESHKRLIERGPTRLSPFFVPKLMINSASGNVAIRYRLSGPNFSVSSACASANHAMGIALRLIQTQEADIVLTGGSEAALTSLGLSGFACMRALSKRNHEPQKASRPFDRDRDGFVLGEGAAILVFESLEHAVKRGAKIYAEVSGFGQSDDAYHITAPDPDGTGATLSMKRALDDAGLRPEEISYINAHGTSTPLNDRVETMAIKKVFGEYAYKVPISATKSMIGHLLGAAGAVELVATIMSCITGIVHPTTSYENPDPECDLDYVPNTKRSVEVKHAISNSLGFGGHNSTIVISKFTP